MTNNKDKKVLNVPNLRFLEFTGEWKKCIIGELTTKVGSGVTPRGGEAVYKSEGHPFVRSQNVGLGHLILDDIAYIDEDTHQRQKNTELQTWALRNRFTVCSAPSERELPLVVAPW